ncbi:hypothetical protein DEM25_003695 [Oceaniradius stylonematis]|uniref:Mobilization protein n=1 Tax=Oceaniradius stylonematis TaxID=2184161 RepID=A0A3A8AAP8_9HYPH|nr:hypothetical protein [Oceaniradius stylonematis]RKF06996.1 hypothetical protein DEM25_003695 [Oceaniradius stylonematis]
MSVVTEFAASATPKPHKPKRKRPAPFSIRLNDAELAKLLDEAKGAPLSAYIKAKALGAPLRLRRSGLSIKDRQALAQALALLGNGDLAKSLSEIAHAASIGVLPLTPETESVLLRAVQDVRGVRRLLVQALGLQEADQ